MKEYVHEEEVETGQGLQTFKVKITSVGTVNLQFQATDEGFDDIEGGVYSATTSSTATLGTGKFRVLLTGDARFFMG